MAVLRKRYRPPSGKAAVTAVLAATAVVLSPLSFPIGPTRVYPAQHMINGVGGVLLGPWYATLAAVVAAIIRNALGTGTIFAFPGGIPGALIVGVIHRYLWKRDFAALTEPIGTTIGAVISALLVLPLALQLGFTGLVLPLEAFIVAFLVSSVPGSILGLAVLLVVRKTRSLIL
jgi:energy coupling factor transporter S component ThiW